MELTVAIPGASGTIYAHRTLQLLAESGVVETVNLIMSGNAANNGGTARFRTLNTTNITQGSVAAAALVVSQKTCVAADVTAGICTNAQLNRRLLDLNVAPVAMKAKGLVPQQRPR